MAAALQMSRLGKRAVIAEFGRHLGGLSSGGLGATDIGNKAAIGGIAREFYRRLGKHYGQAEMWTFEPHVAEQTFRDMIQEADVPVCYEQRLKTVKKADGQIREIVMESGLTFRAGMFIDATYESNVEASPSAPYPISYRAIVPGRKSCSNLLAPVCLNCRITDATIDVDALSGSHSPRRQSQTRLLRGDVPDGTMEREDVEKEDRRDAV